jgi:hypothetical protein
VSKERGKRIFLSLPPAILDALERWAESEGNRPTSLANWIVETAVREALEKGKIPNPTEPQKSVAPTELKAFLTQLAYGELPTNGQLVTLAHDLGIPTETLMAIRDRVSRQKKEGQSNGT